MLDTAAYLDRLRGLISEAEEMERRGDPPSVVAVAWRASAVSLLSKLVGSGHVYDESFRKATDGFIKAEKAFSSEISHGRAVLHAVKADLVAGIEFHAGAKDSTAEAARVEQVLLRVEELLRELVHLVRERRRE